MKRNSARGGVIAALLATIFGLGWAHPVFATSQSETIVNQVAAATARNRVADHGRKVTADKCLVKYAAKQAKWMADNQSVKHQNLFTVAKACKLNGVGENVAFGFANGNQVVKAWMNSSCHRANLLDNDFRLVGHAAYKDANGTWWVAQVFGQK